jgi:RNA-directed DNA polymerase
MKESYDEGIASHIGPESCAFVREDKGEALIGVRAGRVWSREILLKFKGPTMWDEAEGNIGRIVSARCVRTLRGRRPCARTETPHTGIGRSHGGLRVEDSEAASGSPRT